LPTSVADARQSVTPSTRRARKVQIQYEQVVGKSSAGRSRSPLTLSTLATLKLELDIKPEPPPAAAEKK
jgi:hypothetical protein